MNKSFSELQKALSLLNLYKEQKFTVCPGHLIYLILFSNVLYSINSKGFNFGNNIVLYISSFSLFKFCATSIYISLFIE